MKTAQSNVTVEGARVLVARAALAERLRTIFRHESQDPELKAVQSAIERTAAEYHVAERYLLDE